jgi:hypothetical protein
MNDRELLELAAKAAGTYYVESESWDENAGWNPLTNDGDALRLAVKLRFKIYHGELGAIVERKRYSREWIGEADDDSCGDRYAATRRAIVRAAAEVGKGIIQPRSENDLPEDNYYKEMAEAEEIGRSQS